MSSVVNSGTPIQSCPSAQLYDFEDGCQAQVWKRCAICGAHEGQTCELSDDTVAYKYLNASQHSEAERIKKVNDALAFGRWYAKQMVNAERAKQKAEMPLVPETDVPGWLKTWRLISSIIAIIVLSQWAISLIQ